MLADSRARPRYGVDGFPYIVGLGGVISDLSHIERYAEWFTAAGCAVVSIQTAKATFPPQKVLVVKKC